MTLVVGGSPAAGLTFVLAKVSKTVSFAITRGLAVHGQEGYGYQSIVDLGVARTMAADGVGLAEVMKGITGFGAWEGFRLFPG